MAGVVGSLIRTVRAIGSRRTAVATGLLWPSMGAGYPICVGVTTVLTWPVVGAAALALAMST